MPMERIAAGPSAIPISSLLIVKIVTERGSALKIRFAALGIAASAVLCTLVLSGCHAYAKLYPVQGPLAQLSPPPVYAAKVTGGVNVDNFYATIANGEKVSCAFTRSSGKQRFSDPQPAPSPDPFNMAPAWDAVFGSRFYDAHVLGSHDPYYSCSATGDKGTTLHVAIQVGLNPNATEAQSVKGVVEDDKGNIYKFAL